MSKEEIITEREQKTRYIKDLVNTPFKKAMFVVQVLSWVLIVGSPIIGGSIGSLMDLTAGKIAGLIFGIFLAGEILFYGTLLFLGKEVLLLVKDKAKRWFKKKKQESDLST